MYASVRATSPVIYLGLPPVRERLKSPFSWLVTWVKVASLQPKVASDAAGLYGPPAAVKPGNGG